MGYFFVLGILIASVGAYGMYYVFQHYVLLERMKLDDAKGYYLISCIVMAFIISAASFYIGQQLGYDQKEPTSSMMALAILLDIMATLLVLIYGLVKFHEPEHY